MPDLRNGFNPIFRGFIIKKAAYNFLHLLRFSFLEVFSRYPVLLLLPSSSSFEDLP